MTEIGLKDQVTAKIADFLEEIGLHVRTSTIAQQTFLPGIHIEQGVIVIDETKLRYPGDLLHEAGHIAVTARCRRAELCGDVGQGAAEELAAIAWSYAAVIHLGLEPSVVFHPAGYRGGSESMLQNFKQGRYIGVPMLEWLGMALEEKRARPLGLAPYPAMVKWLRD